MPVIVLDAEALSVFASPEKRGASARRAQAILQAAAIRPAPVMSSAGHRGRQTDHPYHRRLLDEVLPAEAHYAAVAAEDDPGLATT